MNTDPGNELRIGQLADLSGTTTRTIRHYHSIGLLKEPGRDSSGYRRYGAEHLVKLVRIRRLRNLGMPLNEIATSLGGEAAAPSDLAGVLRLLADDISHQIESLQELRTRVLDLSDNESLGRPVEVWADELRRHGLLDEAAQLPEGEHPAVELIDALQPGGISGAIATASGLLSDPATVQRTGELLDRFRALADDADNGTVDSLAADYVAVLPRPEQSPEPVDVDLMDKLVGDRFSTAQLRCLHRVRELLEERDR